MRRSDITIVVSAAEAQLLARQHGIGNTVVIITIDEIATTVPSFTGRRDLVFVGYFAMPERGWDIVVCARGAAARARATSGVCLHVIGAVRPLTRCGNFARTPCGSTAASPISIVTSMQPASWSRHSDLARA